MSDQQALQSEQYAFPYHYLPVYSARPKLTRHWAFAPSYIAALTIISDWMRTLPMEEAAARWRHIDLGCGDGALLYHLSESEFFSDCCDLYGSDYDVRALEWARKFNSKANIMDLNINDLDADSFDSATLVEVAEHIPPTELGDFFKSVARVLKPGGKLAVTVPSMEKRTEPKHFQHFSFESLNGMVSEHFELLSIRGFEKHTLLSKILFSMLYRTRMRIEFPNTATVLVETLARLHPSQKKSGRIFAVFQKR